MRDPRTNENFLRWFDGSKVVNPDGSPRVMYHGTTDDFDTFDPAKIKAVDTDAPFNGFWFSGDHDTSPAFRNATNVMPVYLAIKNPAPWQIWRKVAKETMLDHRADKIGQRSRSVNDEVRHRLSDMGYDGILFNGRPDINAEELETTGETNFRDVRGYPYTLRKETKPEMVWGDVTDTFTSPQGEIVRKDGTREPLEMSLETLVAFIVDTPGADVSGFDFNDRIGVIKLPNGDRIESKMVTTHRPSKDWVHTGKDINQLAYYDGHEHITSYADLEDFISSHDLVWVCFFPQQIKSVYNRGSWDASSAKITEGLRGWIDIVSRI